MAAKGENLLLVARSEAKLAALCAELKAAHGIDAEYIAQDLGKEDAAAALSAETERRGLVVETLINNAGFGAMGDFARLDLMRAQQMIDLNIKALVALTYFYLAPMRRRKQGTIINVASTAAFQGVPYMAVYAATKAFVLSFTEALWEENRADNIRVMALCPGVTDTNFFDAAEAETKPPMRIAQTPQQVVKTALRGLDRGRSHIISGWSNYFVTEAERLVPRWVVERLTGLAMRPIYGNKKTGNGDSR